ncbi:hypothetical protein [Methanoculleus sp.]|uniref:hypothetical protein n=1 Tax=Methanoculleus sp. TaxID=90427 RepID=UPI0025ECA571|nr:hypothetical protein [Methanoculleus sp.]
MDDTSLEGDQPGETPAPEADVTPTSTYQPEETTMPVDPTPSVTTEPTPAVTVDPTPTATVDPTPTTTVDPTPSATLDPTPTVTVDPTSTTTAGPDSGNETSGNTTVLNESTPVPTNSTDPFPLLNATPGPGIAENESTGSSPGDSTLGEVPSRMTVLCIWEQLDPAAGSLDDDPVQPGSQFLPPCAYGATETVQIRAVIAGGGAAPYPVVAEVTLPDGSAFSQINLTSQDSPVGALEAASTAGLITYAQHTSLNDVVRALEEDSATVYAGEVDLSFCEAPGDYHVVVRVLSDEEDPAEQSLASIFTYVPTASFEIDFAAVNYGTVEQGIDAWVRGDTVFGTAQYPTVRNTGNVPVSIIITQDDMGLDDSVVYTAKLGNDGTLVTFGPMEEVTLPGAVPVNEATPLSLALKISSGEGTPYGKLRVSCTPVTGEN